MSQNPRLQRKWLHRAVAAVVVLACYWTVHCETSEYVRALGTDHVCRDSYRRTFGNRYIPHWVKCFFRPAELVDRVIFGTRWIDDL